MTVKNHFKAPHRRNLYQSVLQPHLPCICTMGGTGDSLMVFAQSVVLIILKLSQEKCKWLIFKALLKHAWLIFNATRTKANQAGMPCHGLVSKDRKWQAPKWPVLLKLSAT